MIRTLGELKKWCSENPKKLVICIAVVCLIILVIWRSTSTEYFSPIPVRSDPSSDKSSVSKKIKEMIAAINRTQRNNMRNS